MAIFEENVKPELLNLNLLLLPLSLHNYSKHHLHPRTCTHLNAVPTISLQDYIVCNPEAVMKSCLFDLGHEHGEHDVELLISSLGAFIRARQADYTPVTWAGVLVDELMEKYKDRVFRSGPGNEEGV
ncbi:hypothetical protein M422DRAFT_277096 [Sphaerobolus stellatus SS14]|uniref:Uncharacterized protein n=1 Tax=Sphaerobolus stellatus (strain SS14) TaxID=990650 RepID=A0A0C9TKV4_SPHS4|nr:hypothetical protein M422DRAFT_277096 [Sphaerobolus stellatus SS14]